MRDELSGHARRVSAWIKIRRHLHEVHAADALVCRDGLDERRGFVETQAAHARRAATRRNTLVEAVDVDAQPKLVDAVARASQRFLRHSRHAASPHIANRDDAQSKIRGARGQVCCVGERPDADLDEVLRGDGPVRKFLEDAAVRRAARRLAFPNAHVVMRVDHDDADAAALRAGQRRDDRIRKAVVATEDDDRFSTAEDRSHRFLHGGMRRKDICWSETADVAEVVDAQSGEVDAIVGVVAGHEAERFADGARAVRAAFAADDRAVERDAPEQKVGLRGVVDEKFGEARVLRVDATRRPFCGTRDETHRGPYAARALEVGVDADLVIRSATLATLEGSAEARGGVEADDCAMEAGWTIAMKEGRISWVGPDSDWRGKAKKVLDAKRRLVTPGFVDSHTHLVYGGDRANELKLKLQGRSYMEIIAAGGGIMSTVRATRAATDNQLEEQALVRLRYMASAGTTTLEAKSGYGLDTATEKRILEVHPRLTKRTGLPIVSSFLGAHAVPDEFRGRTDAYVDLVVDEMLPAVSAQGIARFCDVFVEEDVFTFEQGERILQRAKALDFQLRMHADEIVNTKGAELAAQVGCISADHLLRVSDAGVAAMAEAGTIATLMPSVPLTMMKPQWAPAAKLLAADVPVALASDHNPNNPVTDMGFVAQLGCYAMGLTPAQALTAATWNAACALDVQDQVGSIEVGKRANVLIHDARSLEHWVYELGRSTVSHVVLSGKLVPRA